MQKKKMTYTAPRRELGLGFGTEEPGGDCCAGPGSRRDAGRRLRGEAAGCRRQRRRRRSGSGGLGRGLAGARGVVRRMQARSLRNENGGRRACLRADGRTGAV